MYLIANGIAITRDGAMPYVKNGGVAVEGTTIIEVNETDALKAKYPQAEYIDARGMVIMPAFINAHSHIYSALARGLSIKGHNPTNFYEILNGMWWKLDRSLTLEDTRRSAYTTYIDCIKTGCTTLFDHHASYGEIEGSLLAIEEVAKELGVRTCLCYEVSDRDGEAKCDAAIRENGDFIRRCEQRKDPMVKAMFGGHALFTLSDKTFEKMVRENDGKTGYHIHVAEGLNDVYDSLRKYGTRSVNRLLQHGILGPKTLLGHCIHITPAEMDIIKETDTMVVNNPESNMGNAVGCSPILPMLAKGILVGMGTDAYTFDMLESLKAGLTIQRHNACLPNVAWGEVTDMLFKNNRQIAGRYFPLELGVLKSGAAADVIVMDYKPFTPLNAGNIDGHMIFGMTGRQCETTMCNGRLLMRDRKLIGIDEEAINARTMEAAQKLWARLNG
ncbi:MAG: putative aminohydrolase SsnA [Christensenellaceae bacterium]|jgi:putative selenium metabolism protein SsnA|nr:putative aminohydrolase SsnA [Christensenellaceae bacterium]